MSMIVSMSKEAFALVVLSFTACAAPRPDPKTEAKEFYAKQNETRAQHQAQRARDSQERAKEKNERLDAEDANRHANYDARRAQQKDDAEAKRVADDRAQQEQEARGKEERQARYLAKKEAQEKKDAEEESAVAAEISTCRANPQCTWVRVSVPLCTALKDKRDYQQDMAKEKANPAGVVNLKYLHDLGQQIQLADENIAMFRKDYREQMRRPFNESACPK